MIRRPLIIGGGPAGAAAAIHLARGGMTPLLVERSTGPHAKVCGGFLSWDMLAALRGLGVDPAALGAAPIMRLRLVNGSRIAEAALPGEAAGLSRYLLDEALLQQAALSGADVRRGVTVRAVEDQVARLADGSALDSAALFLATGKHELRGVQRDTRGADTGLVGFRLTVRLSPAQQAALGQAIELIFYEGGYAGLQPIEQGHANLCLLVRRERLAEAGGGWEALRDRLIAETPHLSRRMDGAEALDDKPQAISDVPYGYRARATQPGLFRLGDQAAVIPSLAGDGMAIALASARMAANAFLRGDEEAALRYQRRFADITAVPVFAAMAVQRLTRFPAGRQLMVAAAALLPGAARIVARMTRVPG